MKNIIGLLVCGIAAFGCSGADDTTELFPGNYSSVTYYDPHPDIPVPGQEGRIDGTPWEDGLFNSPEAKDAFCAEYGDLEEAWFCSDLGTVQNAFKSVHFHGILKNQSGGTCYGPNTTQNKDCVFPAKKQFRVKIDSSACFTGSAPPNGPSTMEEQAYLDAMREGVKKWNGHGGVTVVNDGSSGSSGYTLITIKCGTPKVDAALAEGGLSGVAVYRGDLPEGPSGRWPKRAYVIDGTVFTFSPQRAFNFSNTRCGTGSGSLSLRVATAKYVAIHEMGHILGFSHFSSGSDENIMDGFIVGCAPPQLIHSSFDDALSNFNPSSGSLTVVSGTLSQMTPM